MQQLLPDYVAGSKRGDIYMTGSWYASDGVSLLEQVSAKVGSRPAAALTQPANDASVVGPQVLLQAAASSPDRAIKRVEFFTAGMKIGEVVTPPYDVQWLDAPKGRHSLSVRVTDAADVMSYSEPVLLTVK